MSDNESATTLLQAWRDGDRSALDRLVPLVLALDDALSELDRQDPEKAKILELKYFGGMTAEDSAALLDIAVHKINRQMRLAQAWL
ncbi:MAG TPA: ECF-type sigma factor, partial [Bryobacteraceae bacterium]